MAENYLWLRKGNEISNDLTFDNNTYGQNLVSQQIRQEINDAKNFLSVHKKTDQEAIALVNDLIKQAIEKEKKIINAIDIVFNKSEEEKKKDIKIVPSSIETLDETGWKRYVSEFANLFIIKNKSDNAIDMDDINFVMYMRDLKRNNIEPETINKMIELLNDAYLKTYHLDIGSSLYSILSQNFNRTSEKDNGEKLALEISKSIGEIVDTELQYSGASSAAMHMIESIKEDAQKQFEHDLGEKLRQGQVVFKSKNGDTTRVFYNGKVTNTFFEKYIKETLDRIEVSVDKKINRSVDKNKKQRRNALQVHLDKKIQTSDSGIEGFIKMDIGLLNELDRYDISAEGKNSRANDKKFIDKLRNEFHNIFVVPLVDYFFKKYPSSNLEDLENRKKRIRDNLYDAAIISKEEYLARDYEQLMTYLRQIRPRLDENAEKALEEANKKSFVDKRNNMKGILGEIGQMYELKYNLHIDSANITGQEKVATGSQYNYDTEMTLGEAQNKMKIGFQIKNYSGKEIPLYTEKKVGIDEPTLKNLIPVNDIIKYKWIMVNAPIFSNISNLEQELNYSLYNYLGQFLRYSMYDTKDGKTDLLETKSDIFVIKDKYIPASYIFYLAREALKRVAKAEQTNSIQSPLRFIKTADPLSSILLTYNERPEYEDGRVAYLSDVPKNLFSVYSDGVTISLSKINF